jgi:hypothetical protein
MLFYILVIIVIFLYFLNILSNTTQETNIKEDFSIKQGESGKKEEKNTSNEANKPCLTDLDLIDTLKIHLEKIGKMELNRNLLKPDVPIAHNYSDNLSFNILNQYGEKDNQKRRDFIKEIAGDTISYNRSLLLKNYNRNLFSNLNKENYEFKC